MLRRRIYYVKKSEKIFPELLTDKKICSIIIGEGCYTVG